MARIIIVGNQKGGVGKTTISVHLATLWADQKKRVLLVDADPQGSAYAWLGDDSPVVTTRHVGPGIGAILRRVAAKYDVILVDLPPGLAAAATEESIRVATDVLIPVQPSGLDVAAAIPYIELARTCGKRARIVINRQSRAKSRRAELRGALAVAKTPVCRIELGNRVAFADCMPSAETVFSYEPKGRAAEEMRALGGEVWKNETRHP